MFDLGTRPRSGKHSRNDSYGYSTPDWPYSEQKDPKRSRINETDSMNQYPSGPYDSYDYHRHGGGGGEDHIFDDYGNDGYGEDEYLRHYHQRSPTIARGSHHHHYHPPIHEVPIVRGTPLFATNRLRTLMHRIQKQRSLLLIVFVLG